MLNNFQQDCQWTTCVLLEFCKHVAGLACKLVEAEISSSRGLPSELYELLKSPTTMANTIPEGLTGSRQRELIKQTALQLLETLKLQDSFYIEE